MRFNDIKRAIALGIPVFISYIPTSMTFGLLCKNFGLTLIDTMAFPVLILSGSAQIMAINMFFGGAGLFGIFFTIFLMNFRFFLMGSALTKNLHSSSEKYLPIIAGTFTDESFAIASLQEEKVRPEFLLTFQSLGYIVWVSSTCVGYILGSFLPKNLSLALGISIYALFISMLVPQMKKSLGVSFVVLFSGLLNWTIKYFELLPQGWNIFVTIIIASFIGSFVIEKLEGDNV